MVVVPPPPPPFPPLAKTKMNRSAEAANAEGNTVRAHSLFTTKPGRMKMRKQTQRKLETVGIRRHRYINHFCICGKDLYASEKRF